MKLRIPALVLLAVLLVSCATDKGTDKAGENHDEQAANTVSFKNIDLENVPLSEAIAYLNENQNTHGSQKVTVTVVTQPIKDFSRNPDVEIADMMSTRVSAKGENLSLDQALEQLLKDVPRTAQGTKFITFYVDSGIDIFPRKYLNAYSMYSKHLSFDSNYRGAFLETMISLLNQYFDGFKNSQYEDMQIKLNVPDEAEKKKLLVQFIKGPFGDNPSLADLIAIVRKQLNLNCYLDDDGNLSLEPKAPAQP